MRCNSQFRAEPEDSTNHSSFRATCFLPETSTCNENAFASTIGYVHELLSLNSDQFHRIHASRHGGLRLLNNPGKYCQGHGRATPSRSDLRVVVATSFRLLKMCCERTFGEGLARTASRLSRSPRQHYPGPSIQDRTNKKSSQKDKHNSIVRVKNKASSPSPEKREFHKGQAQPWTKIEAYRSKREGVKFSV